MWATQIPMLTAHATTLAAGDAARAPPSCFVSYRHGVGFVLLDLLPAFSFGSYLPRVSAADVGIW